MEDKTTSMEARAAPPGASAQPEETAQTGSLDVVEMDPSVDGRWEAFVAAHPQGTVYHHPAWLRVLQHEYRQGSLHLACIDGAGRIQGVLPMLRTRGLPGGIGGHAAERRLASLPRTPIGGPLAAGAAAAAVLVQHAVQRVDSEPGVRLQLKQAGTDLDGLVPLVERAPWRTSYVLDLPERAEQVRFGDSRNHTRIKSAVAKSIRVGVAVRPADTTEDLRRWYELYLETMRAHVVPPRPYRLFLAMWELMRPLGMMRLLIAETGVGGSRRVIAGSILLMYGRTVYYAFNSRDAGMLHLRSNDALQWRAIHDAAAEGFRQYDLGEVSAGNHGLADFKRKWGSEVRQLHRYHYPPIELDRPPEHPSDEVGRIKALAKAAWHRVPTRLTAVVGEQVYRFL